MGALVLGLYGFWFGLVGSVGAMEAPAPLAENGKVPFIYQKKRSFRIPFHIDEQGKSRLKEVQLWVSEDSGYHWEGKSTATPDLGKFTFRAAHDGEYWFATRTVTRDGKSSPPMEQEVEPSMKVIIDTLPPSLVLEPDGRRGSTASVRWEIKDEHLDLRTLTIEYQQEGDRQWRKVPIRRPALMGAESWDAGTADALRVRASVADKAGNVAESQISLKEGTAGAQEFGALDADPPGASVEPISQPSSTIVEGPGFPPIQESPPVASRAANAPIARRSVAARARVSDQRPAAPGFSSAPNWENSGPGTAASSAPNSAQGSAPPFGDPFLTNEGGSPSAASPSPRGMAAGAAGADARGTLLVPSPRFKLQYAIEDAGPEGPASVELWMTQDGGRTWIRRGEDPDRVSPMDIDLGGEGTFGLCLVARSASGLGDQPPAPGDPPQSWVEVDSTPPAIQLYPPQIGTGPHAGKVAITWRVSDLHVAPNSVSLQWRPDQPGAAWQPIMDGQENMGRYIWTVPPSFPAKFHVRVEAVDTLGHHGFAETPETAPVIVDRSRPRSRIIGLDPNARAGDGPAARPLR